jgi:hypothetical protein
MPSTGSTSALPHGYEPPLNTEQAARFVGLRPRTLIQRRHEGGGPPYLKLGNRVRYMPSDLRRWLEARRRTSTSDPGPASPPATATDGPSELAADRKPRRRATSAAGRRRGW